MKNIITNRIMKKQALSIEQMNHLRELGLDTRDASFCWSIRTGLPNLLIPYNDEVFERCAVTMTMPAYTLQDLLDKLPDGIDMEDYVYWLYIDMSIGSIYYESYDCGILKVIHANDSKTLLDAAYELLVWCIEEGYVKTKGGGNDAVNDEIKQGKEKE